MKHTNTVFYQLLRFIPKHRFDDAVKRHQGLDVEILEKRKKLYQRKRNKHPERWSGNAGNWESEGAVELNPEQNKVAA